MIELKSVTKLFDQRGIAGVHHLDLKIKKGEILALLGPNGSGKTTILNLIADIIKPDCGVIHREGIIQYAHFDNPGSLKVQEYLISKANTDIDEEKKILLARNFADIFEFTTQFKQDIQSLSAGQRQKVLLAGELINNPKILLMDEPFSHLDPFTRKDILNSLFSYIKQQEMTILWVTHERKEALKYASLIAVINFGKIEQLDFPSSINFKPKNLFVAQFMGYENFLPILPKDKDSWITPWGDWQINSSQFNHEGIMVIPKEAWGFSDNKSNETYVLASFANDGNWELEVSFQEKIYIVKMPSSTLIEKTLKLVPNFEHCFIIPL